MGPPTLKPALRRLILEALARDYISISGHDSIETGNHYQSLVLGDTRTAGFRTDRGPILDRINFSGARVLDLGSNLGELSRAVRNRGAQLVGGFEYDPFYLEIAGLVNVLNGTTRVSFSRQDITRSTAYRERYDIVLAMSVFVYIKDVLADIAAIVDEGILVLETHNLDNSFRATYLDRLLPVFPHYRFLGNTEWGIPCGGQGKRAVLAFARCEDSLSRYLGSTEAESAGRLT
jgi:2-polyprenyl-3-methyl-5-hydroxy-6-metoxy-1,4-benzoquinol methylase